MNSQSLPIDAALGVDGDRDGFKMVWVHAATVPAEMIDRQFAWIPDEYRPRKSVWENGLSV